MIWLGVTLGLGATKTRPNLGLEQSGPFFLQLHFGLDTGNVGAFFSPGAVGEPQKSRRATDSLFLSDWPFPVFAARKRGDGRCSSRSPRHLHRRFNAQRLPSKKTARMGDKAKPLASLGRRLCCLNFSLFVLAVTSAKIEPRSDAPAAAMQRAGERPPYGQKT
jgi:hypothetical protein